MSWIKYGILSIWLAVVTSTVHGDWRNYGTADALPDVMIAGNIVTPTLAMFVAQERGGELSLVVTLPLKTGVRDTTELVFSLPERKPYRTTFNVLRRTDTHIVMKTGDVTLIAALSGLQGEFPYVDVSGVAAGRHRFDLTGITTALLGLATASLK